MYKLYIVDIDQVPNSTKSEDLPGLYDRGNEDIRCFQGGSRGQCFEDAFNAAWSSDNALSFVVKES